MGTPTTCGTSSWNARTSTAPADDSPPGPAADISGQPVTLRLSAPTLTVSCRAITLERRCSRVYSAARRSLPRTALSTRMASSRTWLVAARGAGGLPLAGSPGSAFCRTSAWMRGTLLVGGCTASSSSSTMSSTPPNSVWASSGAQLRTPTTSTTSFSRILADALYTCRMQSWPPARGGARGAAPVAAGAPPLAASWRTCLCGPEATSSPHSMPSPSAVCTDMRSLSEALVSSRCRLSRDSLPGTARRLAAGIAAAWNHSASPGTGTQ
mmetsp:Transcript_40547/g.101967  ORF Transcript_40547/g.101967 Transcript_40547/m.101967 type:complete len:268 (-) Transcript_40547:135-938(-)